MVQGKQFQENEIILVQFRVSCKNQQIIGFVEKVDQVNSSGKYLYFLFKNKFHSTHCARITYSFLEFRLKLIILIKILNFEHFFISVVFRLRTRCTEYFDLREKSRATVVNQSVNATYFLNTFKGMYAAKDKCPSLFSGIMQPVTLNGFGNSSYQREIVDIQAV